jgi:hypothetical protein
MVDVIGFNPLKCIIDMNSKESGLHSSLPANFFQK